jgi:hypothetical protein
MKRLFLISALLFVNYVYSNGIFETFEVNNQDPFTGTALLNWIGDVGDFKTTSSTWPSSPAPDFLGDHSLRSLSYVSDINLTILTEISSFYLSSVRTRWEVFVSGGSIDITLSKGFSMIILVNSSNISDIESGLVNGYRLRLADPSGTSYPDGLYLEKASGSGWTMIDSVHTGDAKINQGWNLVVERDGSGNWYWGYSNGVYNTNIELSESVYDNDFVTGSYTGMNYYSISSASSAFGFDNFKVDPYTPGMWREEASTNLWSNSENWEDGLVPGNSTNVQIVKSNNPPLVDIDCSCHDLNILADASLTINSGKTLTVNGDFLIESNSEGDGQFIDHGNLLVSGSSVVQRYLAHYGSGSNEFHFVSIPTADHAVENALNHCYVYPYNETENSWFSLNEGDQLQVGRGYSVYYTGDEDFTALFSGKPNTGDQNITVNATNFSGDIANDNWNLLGNPFPSAIDWDEVIKSNIESAVYIWNPSSLTYASYVSGVGSNMNNDGIIPPMQAFFVHAASDGSFTIPQVARTNNHSQDYLKNTEDQNQSLKIIAHNNDFRDEAIIRQKTGASGNFDHQFDAYKFLSEDASIQIYTLDDNFEKMSINTIAEDETLFDFQLGLVLNEQDSVAIEFKGILNFKTSYDLVLEDRLDNKTMELTKDTLLQFYALVEEENRFILHIIPHINKISKISRETSKIWVSNEKIHVVLPPAYDDIIVTVFDIMGRIIRSEIRSNIHQFTMDKPTTSGIYIIQVKSNDKVFCDKVFVNNE